MLSPSSAFKLTQALFLYPTLRIGGYQEDAVHKPTNTQNHWHRKENFLFFNDMTKFQHEKTSMGWGEVGETFVGDGALWHGGK